MKHVVFLSFFLFCCLQANSQNYFQLANECFEKGDYECAKRNYTFFQTFDGSNMSAQIQKADECFRALILGDNYFKDEEWEKAMERYKILLEKNPIDPHAKKQLALCEENLKSINEIPDDVADENNLLEEELLMKEDNQQITVDEVDEVNPFENANLPVQDTGMFYQWNRRTAWATTGNITGWDNSNDISGNTWDKSNDPSPEGWRIPTVDEFLSLLNASRVSNEWTMVNGKYGRRFTDRTTNKSIFLPAAGWRGGLDGILADVGENGSYWSSTRYEGDRMENLRFLNTICGLYNELPSYGFPLRSVAE